MTFSIVARCPQTGMFGVGIASSSPAVSARCSFVEANVGAVASQNITDPRLGAGGLTLLRAGANAEETLKILQNSSAHIAYRQLLAVDKNGGAAIFSGDNTLGVWRAVKADNVACAGNLLADEGVPQAMLLAYQNAGGDLPTRLLTALDAALAAGGEAGPVHSAGIKVAHQTPWAFVDLRCDWSDDCPIAALKRAWAVYQPQKDDYIQRALNPAAAPVFGVPGDE